MTAVESYLKGKRILAVDDEEDILETIEDILENATVDRALDYETASRKIAENRYDIAILDIMGVKGLSLLEETVEKGIPTVMLTAHAINPGTLMESVRKGAISYLPKETLAELDDMLNAILSAHDKGDPPWKLLFDKLGGYFNERFGPDWQNQDNAFWEEFNRSYQVGKGIQQRMLSTEKVRDKGGF